MNETILSSIQSNAFQEIKNRVMKRFEVVDFFLYGSAARGEADEESDLDLMIIISDKRRNHKGGFTPVTTEEKRAKVIQYFYLF